MKQFMPLFLLLSTLCLNAMEKEFIWGEQEEKTIAKALYDKKITEEQGSAQMEIIKKKRSLWQKNRRYKFMIERNDPNEALNAYKEYVQLVNQYGTNFDEKLNNPYSIIAKEIKDGSVGKMIDMVNENGWPINDKKSIEYGDHREFAVTYWYTAPLGQAIRNQNREMFIVLLAKGANWRAKTYREGYRMLLPEALHGFNHDYNAFEHALYENQPEFAQMIYEKDNTIVHEGSPLKVAVHRAATNTAKHAKVDVSWLKGVPLFTFAHSLVIKHKPELDHSLLKIACIDCGSAIVTQELIGLGYSTDYKFKTGIFSSSTIAGQVFDWFRNSENKSCMSFKKIGPLIAVLVTAKKFNEKQNTELKELIEDRTRIDNATFSSSIDKCDQEKIRSTEIYKSAKLIKDLNIL